MKISRRFIDKYNETIDKINKKTGEEYYRDYQPLTKEQRESLGEKEVEALGGKGKKWFASQRSKFNKWFR